MANTIIQGVNFKRVATTVGGENEWNIVPFDFGGKALIEMTIEVNSSLVSGILNLPEISSFNGVYGTTIKVIGISTDEVYFPITIIPSGDDTIGGSPSIGLSPVNGNAVFTVINSTTWSVVLTLNNSL